MLEPCARRRPLWGKLPLATSPGSPAPSPPLTSAPGVVQAALQVPPSAAVFWRTHAFPWRGLWPCRARRNRWAAEDGPYRARWEVRKRSEGQRGRAFVFSALGALLGQPSPWCRVHSPVKPFTAVPSPPRRVLPGWWGFLCVLFAFVLFV